MLPARGSSPCRPGSPQASAYGQAADGCRQGFITRVGTARELQLAAAPRLQFVLLLGINLVLLESRRDILGRFGYRAIERIVCATFLLPPLADIVLVHICQTVEPAAAADLARRIRALSPGIAILYTALLH